MMGGKWRNKISNPSLLIKRNIIRLCDSCCISTSLILYRILFYMHCADTHNNIIHLHTCTSIPLSLLYKLSHTHTMHVCMYTQTHTHMCTQWVHAHISFPFFQMLYKSTALCKQIQLHVLSYKSTALCKQIQLHVLSYKSTALCKQIQLHVLSYKSTAPCKQIQLHVLSYKSTAPCKQIQLHVLSYKSTALCKKIQLHVCLF